MRSVRVLLLMVALASSYGLCHAADFLIWDADRDPNSGRVIRDALLGAGYDGEYSTDIAPYLGSLPNYRAIFICTGVFPNYYDLSGAPVAVDSLVSYLTNYDSTNIYLEGGNAWLVCRHHALNPYFNIQGLANGFGDTDVVLGQAGTFTQGMSLSYSGDNAFMDRIAPLSTAFVIFRNSNPVYNNGIAYDDGGPSYRTIGTSFEFGGLVDGTPPSTKDILADTIMHFFRIHRTYYDWDAAAVSIDIPDLVMPDQPLTPRARVRNLGLNPATFGVTCQIGALYSSTDTVYNLAPDSIRQIAFTPDWVAGAVGTSSPVTVYTMLVGDQRRTNDTLRKQIASWDDRWYIVSPYYGSTPPTMDGVMSPGEWDSAAVRDVSDFLGRAGNPNGPGSAYLYVMNDADNFYMALDGIADGSETDGDIFDLWFEDSHDNAWPPYPDSTEGDLTMTHHPEPAGPWFSFEPKMSSGPPHVPYPVGVAGWSGASSGHMQYEVTIPFGTANHHLNVGPGDTVGFWLSAMAEIPFNAVMYGWWPTSSQLGGWNLLDHGDLIFSTGGGIVHDGAVDSITSPPDTVWPGSVQVPAAVVRNLGSVSEVCTVSCTINPGLYSSEVLVVLDPGLPQDVYFLPWDVPPSGITYQMTVKIVVLEDNNPVNDTLSKTIVAHHHDGGVASILSPPDTVAMGDTVSVEAIIGNYGTFLEDSIKVKCTIDGWEDSTYQLGLAPGDLDTATFADWSPAAPGVCTMTIYTLLNEDANPANDTLLKEIYVRAIGVEELVNHQLSITNYQLCQNHPNPFGRTTAIRYAVPRRRGAEAQRGGGEESRIPDRTSHITLTIYDVSGRLVRTLINEEKEPGIYSVTWDRKDETGRPASAGVYFYRLTGNNFTATRKMVVLR